MQHLLVRQRVIRLDGSMAGRGGGDAAQGVADFPASIEAVQILCQRAQRPNGVLTSEKSRDGRQAERFAAEFLDAEAQAIQIAGMVQQRLTALW